jgi:hypothetical protein
MALPLLLTGVISVSSAVAPVGANPALNPWINRRSKKNKTVEDKGYKIETNTEQMAPRVLLKL